jgi:3-deoxy-D-arabino-heptulosonate 7-phosphate (DAHP) synthase
MQMDFILPLSAAKYIASHKTSSFILVEKGLR